MHEEVTDKEMITALLTGLRKTYESMIKTFNNLDDISLQQVKLKLTSREERLNQAKAVTEARVRKIDKQQNGSGSQSGSMQAEIKDVAFVKKRERSRGAGRGQSKPPRSEIDCLIVDEEDITHMNVGYLQNGISSKVVNRFTSKGKKKQSNDDACDDLPGYYNPRKPEGKKVKPVTMNEVVEDKPCFTNPVVGKDPGNSFYIPFVLDNASGVTICGCREAFVSLTSNCDTTMRWFENTRVKAQMKGLVKFAIFDANTQKKVWITLEALHVDRATNLISQRKLYEEYGYCVHTSEDQEITTLKNCVKHCNWQFNMVGGLYQTMVEIPKPQPPLAVLQTLVQTPRSLRLWHQRLAHANWQVIKDMATQGLVSSLELSKLDMQLRRLIAYLTALPIETINMTSTKGNADKVAPHEKMFGSKPSLRHLRPFGCLAMKFVDKVYRKSKLSIKGAPSLMVGWYVEKLLNEVSLPVVDVNEPQGDQNSELRKSDEVEHLPVGTNVEDQQKNQLETEETAESEESFEDKPPSHRKRHYSTELNTPRRSNRVHKKPRWLQGDSVSTVFSSSASATATMKIEVPATWGEMMASSHKMEWLEATKEEFLAQLENATWILVPRPKNAHSLKSKWVWTLKENDHRIVRFKARLVVMGCFQIWEIVFDEPFAPVVRFEALRLVFLWAGLTKAAVKQFDFVTAFLNVPTERIIFMEQPKGFVKRGYEEWMCLLKKSIYGLRQSPRNWNNTLHLSYKGEGLYWMMIEDRLILLPIYVDDILLKGLSERFKLKCLGDVNYLLISEKQNVRDEPESDGPVTNSVTKKKKGRREIPVHFRKRARAKWKLKHE
ncbi:Hypothetical protein PHPALM_19568 [Phytophthora palmivora]|uniref:Reverse transcriptase Ty1/copia-type domain-containing protein n=1 Tax=Phytophthora palmivora TaxID=4796 RepID=A0A2P4XH18_9STRA|nr:Hypothetical protein PHPALM_19568 [Phytophthora palmivora]